MSNDYAGSTNSWPTVIRMPADGEPRNATTLARALEDLADRTGLLFYVSTAESEVATPGALKAVTSALPPIRFVRGYGPYKYEPLYVFSEDQPPWFYAATGIGSGAWVRCDWSALLNGDTTRTKVHPGLLPHKLAGWGFAELTAPLNKVTDTLSPESAGPTVTITDLLPNDRLDLSAGPFFCDSIGDTFLQLKLVEGVNVTFTVESKIKAGTSGNINLKWHRDIPTSQDQCEVTLYCYGNGTITAPVYSQWLHWQILRPEANL